MSRSRLGSLVLLLLLILPRIGSAQQSVGIVTALKGRAQLSRATTQTALSFKDDLILRDIIDTQERSLARILFGGKSTVTVRELSRLEVREETLPTGAVRSIHELSSGGILVNVVQRLLRPGDEVQIRTPNAVAAVRGTTIFARYIRELGRSIFICLTGRCIVTPQGLPAITLTPNTSVDVTGDPAAGVQAGPVGTVTQAEATEIVEASQVEVAVTEEANQEQTAQVQNDQATQLATAVVEAITGVAPTTSEDTQDLAAATTAEPSDGFDPNTAINKVQSVKDDPSIDNPGANAPPEEPGSDEKEAAIAAIEAAVTFSGATAVEVPEGDSLVTSDEVKLAASLEEPSITTLEGVEVNLEPGATFFTFPQGDFNFTEDTFAQIVDSTIIQSGSSLILVSSGANATLAGQLLDVDPSTITTPGSIFQINGALSLGGPLFTDVGGMITADRLLDIDGGSLTSTTTDFLAQFNGSTVNIESDLARIINNGSLDASGPLAKFSGGSLTFGDSTVLNLDSGASLTAGGSFLDLTNLDLDLGNSPVADISGGSTLKNTAGPVIKISGGSLTADALATSDGSNTFELTGTLLDLTDTTVKLRVIADSPDGDSFTHTLAADEPIIKMTNSSIELTDTVDEDNGLIFIEEGEETQDGIFKGVGLIAKDSTLTLPGHLLEMDGKFASTSTSAILQLENTTVTGSSDLILFTLDGSDPTEISLAGQLLNASSNSKFTVGTDASTSGSRFLIIRDGAILSGPESAMVKVLPESSTSGPFRVTVAAPVTVSLWLSSIRKKLSPGSPPPVCTVSSPMLKVLLVDLKRAVSPSPVNTPF